MSDTPLTREALVAEAEKVRDGLAERVAKGWIQPEWIDVSNLVGALLPLLASEGEKVKALEGQIESARPQVERLREFEQGWKERAFAVEADRDRLAAEVIRLQELLRA